MAVGTAVAAYLGWQVETDTSESYASIGLHCCPVDGGYDFNITLQDKGFRCVYFGGTLNSI